MDGQLWMDTNLHEAAYYLPPSALLTLLSTNQGAYIRNLGLHGWRGIPSDAFALAMVHGSGKGSSVVSTRLRKLDLQGCTSLSASALVSLIGNSPELEWLSLRGLQNIDAGFVDAISSHSQRLKHLDLSYCNPISLMDHGVFDQQGSWPVLKTLKLGGGFGANGLLEALAAAAPALETLDVSYSDIDDVDILEFVALSPNRYQEALAHAKAHKFWDSNVDIGAVMLTPSQSGELGSSYPCEGLVPRRVTRLRHLNISHCPDITQDAAAYLAHAVPRLEILEMADVGEMSSEGIVALIQTTSLIRKIDLDGATLACDLVLSALTPTVAKSAQPGHQLETLSIGQSTQITSDAALKLLRACTKLMDLNVEVRITNGTMKTAHASAVGHACRYGSALQRIHSQEASQLPSTGNGLPWRKQKRYRSLRKPHPASLRMAWLPSRALGLQRPFLGRRP